MVCLVVFFVLILLWFIGIIKKQHKLRALGIYDFADGDSYLTKNDPKPWKLEWVAFFRALKYQKWNYLKERVPKTIHSG